MVTKYEIGAPIYHPEQVADLPRLLSRTFEALQPDLLRVLTTFVKDPNPESFLRFEESVQRLLPVVGSHVAAGAVTYLHREAAWVEDLSMRLAGRRPIRPATGDGETLLSASWAAFA